MTLKQKLIVAFAAAEGSLFALISTLMMAGAIFRPSFHKGTINDINSRTIISVAGSIALLVIFAKIHEWTQRWLTKNRPEGTDIHPRLGLLDLVTSLLPVVLNGLVFLAMRIFIAYEPWWLALQMLYGLIVFTAVVEDIKPSIDYYRRNRRHIPIVASARAIARNVAAATPASASAATGATAAPAASTTSAAAPTTPRIVSSTQPVVSGGTATP